MNRREQFRNHSFLKTMITREAIHYRGDISDFISRLDGADPITVKACINELHAENLDNLNFEKLLGDLSNKKARKHNIKFYPDEIVPHPLDYDWSFSKDTFERLYSRIKTSGNSSRILLLGTPRLAYDFELRDANHTIHLIEKNELWRNKFKTTTCHVGNIGGISLPNELVGSFDLVIADPPWYPEQFGNFVSYGSSALKIGGEFILVIPPKGIRPSILSELEELEMSARQKGLRVLDSVSSSISYDTPPFETNSFIAAGIHFPLDNWRVADMWVFEKYSNSNTLPSCTAVDADWLEITISGIRIKLKKDLNDHHTNELNLHSLIPKDIIPSISSKHSLREMANIWSSGNRILRCTNNNRLFYLLTLDRLNKLPGSLPANELCALNKVKSIIEIEMKEYIHNDTIQQNIGM